MHVSGLHELASTGAILEAMAAHPDSVQILQEGTRALEKLCPRAVAKISRLCGSLEALLPPTQWSTGPGQATVQAGRLFEVVSAGIAG